MNAEDKIKEAEFFLAKIVENYDQSPQLEYYFHAFVISARSIADYLLEDYNQKFGLQIPDDDRYFQSTFAKEANTRNGEVLRFYEWYDQKIRSIKDDHVAGELWYKRNFIIHRRGEKLDNLTQMVYGNSIPKNVAIAMQRDYPDGIKFFPTAVIHTKGLGYVDLKEACERFLGFMKDMINDVKEEFE